MDDSTKNVQAYYDGDPDHEWTRFDRQKFEMPVTMHYLEKYLAPHSTILDVGGGPGRYSIALTQQGHTVDLFDLSQKSIALAKQKAAEAGLQLHGYYSGTATDLSRFGDGSYKAVFCMGPMYHLTHLDDRCLALREAIRVLEPSGLLVVSFLSSYAHIFDLVARDPSLILEWDVADLANRCKSSSFMEGDRVFTSSYYIEPFEVSDFMATFPLEKIALIGAQGLVAQGQGILTKTGPDVLDRWIQLSIAVAETNGALGSSIHLVYYARKC